MADPSQSDVPGALLTRRSARLVVGPAPGGHLRSVNGRVQTQLSWAPVDDEPPGQPSGSKKRRRNLTPESEEEAFLPSEEAEESDDEFLASPRTKKPRLVLRAPKPPVTTQGASATTTTGPSSASLPILSTTRKAEPHGEPPVWARGRMALCTTLPYYKAYQSGAYHLRGLCYAVMMDKNSGSGAYLDNEVVITRAGGGSGEKSAEGDNKPTVNQDDQNATIKALINTMQSRVPVVLILGQKNQEVSVVLKHMYSVMGYFIITNVWFEKMDGVSFAKVRFEKRDLATMSWWAPRGSPAPLPADQRDYATKAEVNTCESCGKESAKVYAEGWMCLVASCTAFWTVEGGASPSTVTYNPAFLNERCEKGDLLRPPFDLASPLPQKDKLEIGTQGVSEQAMSGIVCPKCGGCIPRVYWEGWRCDNDGCGYTLLLHLPLVPAIQLSRRQHQYDGHAPRDIQVHDSLDIVSTSLGEWRKDVITIFPGNTLTYFAANKVINSRPGGANDIFEALQQARIGLKRFELANSPINGPTYTKHFTKNWGMPYKYIAAQLSESFKTVPQGVMKAFARLIWAGEQSDTDGSHKPFNELLMLGYMESGAIGWHDDGEDTLGPTIATMSLGCSARMLIRMKSTYYWGRSKKGVIVADDPVLPGCYNYEKRLNLKSLKGKVSQQEYKKLEAEAYHFEKKKGKGLDAEPCITMTVKHGDIIVMNGAALQKYYEHNVIPDGKLRFAMTSRHILPNKIARNFHHMGEFEISPEDAYHGDFA